MLSVEVEKDLKVPWLSWDVDAADTQIFPPFSLLANVRRAHRMQQLGTLTRG